MPLHRLADGQRAIEVVAVVFERLGNGLAHGLVRGEVDDRVDRVLGEDAVKRGAVAGIGLVESDLLAGQLLHTREGFLATVVEVVDDDDIMSRVQQFNRRMRADEAGAASQKNVHGNLSSLVAACPPGSF